MVHRYVHDYLPDCQVSQEESTCQNDAQNANYPQCLRFNRPDHRGHGVILHCHRWYQKLDGLLWNYNCHVSSWHRHRTGVDKILMKETEHFSMAL
jgi:hypothetical protein